MPAYSMARLLGGGAIIGLLDLCAASLSSGKSLFVICQSVASGWFGKASYDLGERSALIGLASQVLMAILITGIFAAAVHWRPELNRRPLLAGIGYGILILLVMAYVVLPLSAVGQPIQFKSAARYAIHALTMIAFGIAVAYVTRWAGTAQGASPSRSEEAILLD